MTTTRRKIGWFEGALAGGYDGTNFAAWLGDLESLLETLPGGSPGQGGTRLLEVDAPGPAGNLPLMIKVFPRQSWMKDVVDRRHGTAAERAWRTATRLREAGVGTPEPLAWLERWQGRRLRFSCLITRRVDGLSNFRDELMHLLRREAYADRLLALLLEVARAVRLLHQSGVYHGDLGNQNILLRRTGEDRWDDVQFVDLNRAKLYREHVPAPARARDLARVYLPSDLRRIFLQMYFGSGIPPVFRRMEERFRRRFAWHSRSRLIRHPIRQWRIRRATDPQRTYPKPRDLWIWDEKSAQPINAWRRPDRERFYPLQNYRVLARVAITHVAAVESAYRELRPTAFGQPVDLAGRFAVAVEPRPEGWERERVLLAGLGRVPVLMRCYRHKGVRQWDHVVAAAKELAAAGHAVAIALVQDRRAVVEPASWAAMAERVLPQLAGIVDWVEVGHAVNRVKWGLWRLSEYRRLVEPLVDLRDAYPALQWMGPGGIDFEYLHVLGALSAVPRSFHFNALSHHLYVDRRGAPENRQGRFDALGKFALARAVARSSNRCADRLIVSEVNWPLADTGVYSPVCSPYLYPGQVVGAPNVSEDDYADYLVRYLLQAACSGFVERVYWWRLAARGFGLVDDAADPWRVRPAYQAFAHLQQTVGVARFVRNLPSPAGIHQHLFLRPDGEQVVVAYAWERSAPWRAEYRFERVESRAGTTFTVAPDQLSGHPLYFRGVVL